MEFRLHSRLVLLNGCALAVAILLLGYFLSTGIRSGIESEIEDQLHSSATLAREFIRIHPGSGDSIGLANELGARLGLRVTIIARDGTVLGDSDLTPEGVRTVENHSDRPEVIQALKTGRGSSIRFSETVRSPFIYVATFADNQILRLAMPLSTVDALLGRLREQLALVMAVCIAMTLLFGYMVFTFVSRPLRRLAEASRALAIGNLDHDIPVAGDRDLAAVASSLNAMARNLRMRMEELRDDKREIEEIVQGMSAGVVVFDRGARAVLANKSILQLLDVQGDVTGRSPMELVRHPAVGRSVLQALEGVDEAPVELTTTGGAILSAKATPVRQSSGQVELAVVVFHDLTELRRIEKMRKDFVANVSHEFKTPLTSISGYAETLLNHLPEDPALTTEFLQAIERNAKLLQALVEDLLVLAQLESEPPVNKEPLDIRAVLDQQVNMRSRLLKEKGIEVEVDCPAVAIPADRGRVVRAVSNLLDNAIHYNRPDGRIRISGRAREDSFAIEVSDTGFGIPQDDLKRVFERFYRVEKSRARDSGGTGLGLAIARHAVESQGGSISVTSKLGIGSTFTITLPR